MVLKTSTAQKLKRLSHKNLELKKIRDTLDALAQEAIQIWILVEPAPQLSTGILALLQIERTRIGSEDEFFVKTPKKISRKYRQKSLSRHRPP